MAFPPQGPWPVFHVSLGCSPASSSPQMPRSKVLPPWRSSPTSPLSMAVPAATLPSAHSRDPSPGWFPPLQRLLLLRALWGLLSDAPECQRGLGSRALLSLTFPAHFQRVLPVKCRSVSRPPKMISCPNPSDSLLTSSLGLPTALSHPWRLESLAPFSLPDLSLCKTF